MKRPHSNLRRVFAEGFAARDLAQSLVCFDGDLTSSYVGEKLGEYGCKVAGIRKNGVIVGYVSVSQLHEGICEDHCHFFSKDEVLPDSASFPRLLKALEGRDYVFLSVFGDVGGWVSIHDLQKPPMRMWLFGMITIVEMEFSRLIQKWYPSGSWQKSLSPERLRKAQRLMTERWRLNQGVNLEDCLQLSDKGRILVKDPGARKKLGFKTARLAKDTFKQLEQLRNNLAHSQDIVRYNLQMILNMTDCLDAMFKR